MSAAETQETKRTVRAGSARAARPNQRPAADAAPVAVLGEPERLRLGPTAEGGRYCDTRSQVVLLNITRMG